MVQNKSHHHGTMKDLTIMVQNHEISPPWNHERPHDQRPHHHGLEPLNLTTMEPRKTSPSWFRTMKDLTIMVQNHEVSPPWNHERPHRHGSEP
ncbi:hypothetical protein SLA2020_509080 [Shorea laevis]